MVLVVASISLRNATLWYERPIPGLLVDAGGLISSIGLPQWESKRLGLGFPHRVEPVGTTAEYKGSIDRVRAWDHAVSSAVPRGFIDAVVDRGVERRVVRLPLRPLEPRAWWVYAGSCIIAGVLYAGAGLVTLW